MFDRPTALVVLQLSSIAWSAECCSETIAGVANTDTAAVRLVVIIIMCHLVHLQLTQQDIPGSRVLQRRKFGRNTAFSSLQNRLRPKCEK